MDINPVYNDYPNHIRDTVNDVVFNNTGVERPNVSQIKSEVDKIIDDPNLSPGEKEQLVYEIISKNFEPAYNDIAAKLAGVTKQIAGGRDNAEYAGTVEKLRSCLNLLEEDVKALTAYASEKLSSLPSEPTTDTSKSQSLPPPFGMR